KYVEELLEKGFAYKCYMTEEELETEREEQRAKGQVPKHSGAHRNLTDEQIAAFKAEGREPSSRIKVPENTTYTFNDIVRRNVAIDFSYYWGWVIVKQNGIATYYFEVVIDDYLMYITHVLRGEEYISNTPLQMMIYDVLGLAAPQCGHLTL